jgi:DNA-binding MarR family transcriptional regulator
VKQPKSTRQAPDAFESGQPLDARLVTGLSKIGLAMKSQAWSHAPAEGLTPTQAQILVLLRDRSDGARLSTIAEALGITAPTASDAVASLVAKKLVVRGRDKDDARAARFSLSRGGAESAARVSAWPDFLQKAVGTLDAAEQAVFLRALVKMIRTLQEAGDIPVQRMCVDCRFFRPHAHPDSRDRPHHCTFVDAPFGEHHIRIDCADHETAAIEQRNHQWARWLAGASDQQPI